MLVIKYNGVYYFRFSGWYWCLCILYYIVSHALITPEPGIEVCIQLSRNGSVKHKRFISWDSEAHDYNILVEV